MALNIFIVGLSGHMGQVTASLCAEDERFQVVGGLDVRGNPEKSPWPLFHRVSDIDCDFDAIIDFSHPSVLPELEALALQFHKPMVIATTGYDREQAQRRDHLAQQLPLFTSANMSLGINLLLKLAEKAAHLLHPQYDIEIVEAHHRRKLDAPSGTALLLAEGIRASLGKELSFCFDRAERRSPRPKDEIGIASVRGGSIVGEHDVIFAGEDEVITLKHSAQSRRVFSAGAAEAALFLQGKANGHYHMDDLLKGVLD